MFWQFPEIEQGKPKGMSVDPDGNIVVVEPHYSRINVFNPDGHLLAQWGEHGVAPGQLSFPRAAVISRKRELCVCEFQRAERVQKFLFSEAGGEFPEPTFVLNFGSFGPAPGQFNRAESLTLDLEGRLIVADACNHRIQVFDTDGKFLRSFGSAGNGASELSYPYDVCVDGQGRYYVCEFGNSRIQVFDDQGRSVEIIGGPGSAPGSFNNPWGVALDSKGNLYVADSQNHRVQKLIRQTAGAQNPQANGAQDGVPVAHLTQDAGSVVSPGRPRIAGCLAAARRDAGPNPLDAGATRAAGELTPYIRMLSFRTPHSALRIQ